MNENILRAAGASHGQEMLPTELEAKIEEIGRTPAIAPRSKASRNANTPWGEHPQARPTLLRLILACYQSIG